jgi:hypothetical protein
MIQGPAYSRRQLLTLPYSGGAASEGDSRGSGGLAALHVELDHAIAAQAGAEGVAVCKGSLIAIRSWVVRAVFDKTAYCRILLWAGQIKTQKRQGNRMGRKV